MMPAARVLKVTACLLLPAAMLAACTHIEPAVEAQPVRSLPDGDAEKREPDLTPDSKSVSIPSGTQYYRVQQGDTLYSIGVRSGYDFHELAQWNGIQSPYKIHVGQKIKLFTANQSANKTIKPRKKSTPELSNPSGKVRKKRFESQKKLILSNDNGKVLKFYCDWPVRGKVVKNFSQTGNKGIDIAVELGQAVKATAGGKVVFSGQGLLGYGNLLIIKHNEAYLSAYGNNSKLLAKEGEQVEAGRIIAEAGKGSGSRASLHFEIRKNGKPVDPIEYLPGR